MNGTKIPIEFEVGDIKTGVTNRGLAVDDGSGNLAISSSIVTDASGNLGINCTPTAKLQVKGNGVGSGAVADSHIALQHTTGDVFGQHYMDGNGRYVILAANNGVAGGNIDMVSAAAIFLRPTTFCGIGTATQYASEKLGVNGDVYVNGTVTAGGPGGGSLIAYNSSIGKTGVLRVLSSGDVEIGGLNGSQNVIFKHAN
ncbi:hypothetical protein BVY04_01260, partial [bacterium M21]